MAVHLGAEGAEPGEVDIERAEADDVPARRAARRVPEASEERSHDEEAGAQIND